MNTRKGTQLALERGNELNIFRKKAERGGEPAYPVIMLLKLRTVLGLNPDAPDEETLEDAEDVKELLMEEDFDNLFNIDYQKKTESGELEEQANAVLEWYLDEIGATDEPESYKDLWSTVIQREVVKNGGLYAYLKEEEEQSGTVPVPQNTEKAQEWHDTLGKMLGTGKPGS